MQPSAFKGFGTHAPGTTIQSVVSRLHLQRETCTNGHGKTISMIPFIIFVFGEFSSPVEPLKEKVVEPRQAIEAMVPMNERWGRLSFLRNDEFNVPAVASIAVCQLCRERQPSWNSHFGVTLTCLDLCIVFVLMTRAPRKAGAKEV